MKTIHGIIILLVGGLGILFGMPEKEIPVYEMIAHIETEAQAERIAQVDGIDLLAYSRFGMAKYSVVGEAHYASLRAIPDLDFEENLGYAPHQVTIDDPLAPEQHALEMLDLYDAWTITTGSKDVTVAVIDTGIDIYHEDLRHNIDPLSYNATTDQVGLEHLTDVDGHGTMVAGVITAAKNNGLGIAGAAPGVNLLVIKAELNENGYFAWFDLAEAIFYAAFNGADVINMSLSGGQDSGNVRRAINTAVDRGAVIVASAGNSASSTPEYPAAFPNTIGVSSVDADYTLSSFSNWGIRVRVTAPGRNIYTTIRGNGSETSPSSRYGRVNGTSFSAPYVSAVLALIKSQFPDLDREAWIEQLYRSSVDLGEPGFDHYFGHGLVNAYHALHPVVRLTLEPNNGESTSTQYVTSSQSVDLETPEFLGHTFTGWYVDETLTEPFDDVTGEGDLTLYAAWEPNTYTISFDTAGGTPLASEDVPFGAAWTPPTPEREGHHFLGWYFDVGAQNELYEDLLPPHDVTLTARWLEATYTFELEAGVDTVMVGTSFSDASVVVTPEFDVVTSGTVDVNTTGRYALHYDLYYEEVFIERLTRMVHVVDDSKPLSLTLEPGLASIPFGTGYTDPGARSTHGTVQTQGAVNPSEAGLYTVTYSVSYEGYYQEVIRKVRVQDPMPQEETVHAILPKLQQERRWIR